MVTEITQAVRPMMMPPMQQVGDWGKRTGLRVLHRFQMPGQAMYYVEELF